jgi:TonB family protein
MIAGGSASAVREEINTREKTENKKPEKVTPDDVTVPASQSSASPQGEADKGPSILTYSLDGRNGVYMPVPAYKCRGGGDVTVIIDVNKQGYVTSADVDTKRSGKDECIQGEALKAALQSRFEPSVTGAISQKGNIVYLFVPQLR